MRAVFCACVALAVCSVFATASANRATAAIQALVDDTNLVAYDPCGAPKCIPRSLQLQDPNQPVIPGYKCDCTREDEKKECGCFYNAGDIAVPCKDGGCPKYAITRIVNPYQPPPRPPRHEVRKFSPPNATVTPTGAPTSGPFAIPVPKPTECVPNVAVYGPGNCARKADSGVYCQEGTSNCKNGDNASQGFVAAVLDTPASPDDKDPQCNDPDSSQNPAEGQQNANGDSVRAVVTITNKCTGKKTTLPAKDVTINPPVILQRNADGSLTPATLPPNAVVTSSESSVAQQSGTQSQPMVAVPTTSQAPVPTPQGAVTQTQSTTPTATAMPAQKPTTAPVPQTRFRSIAADMPVPTPEGVLAPDASPTPIQ